MERSQGNNAIVAAKTIQTETMLAATAAIAAEYNNAPKMPTFVNKAKSHRPLIPDHQYPFNSFVARPVGKQEIAKTPAAQRALDIEWDKLFKAGVWSVEARE